MVSLLVYSLKGLDEKSAFMSLQVKTGGFIPPTQLPLLYPELEDPVGREQMGTTVDGITLVDCVGVVELIVLGWMQADCATTGDPP